MPYRKGQPDGFTGRSFPDETLSRRDNPLPDGQPHQVGIRLKIEFFHNSVLVKCNCSSRNMKNDGSLRHGSAFRKQLEYLALARSQILVVIELRIANKMIDQVLSDSRRYVRSTFQRFPNCLHQLRTGRLLQQIPGRP
jgi:hypothetical protein